MAKTIEELFKERFPNFDPSQVKQEFAPYMNNYNVNISDTTVPMEGQPESLPSQSGGIPEIPPTSGATRSWEETPPQPVEPIKPTINPQEMPQKEAAPPSATPNPLDVLTQSSSLDNESRNKMLESEKSKHNWGLLPVALGGIADAIGNAAAPYGGKGTSGAGTKAAEMLAAGEKGRKTQFEENLKNDPNSQISGHYRNVLAMMMGSKADDPKIKNLSAAQIATTLPEVEKYMAKRLGMEQIKALREKKSGETSTKPTVAQSAVDREFGKDYAKYTAGGGAADTMNQIGSLEEVQLKLEQGKQLTGPIISATPDAIRRRLMPESMAAQQEVEQSIQRTLKQTLGGQFTEREGLLFMQRGYDPALPEAENAKKLKRTINQLKMMATAKQRAADYYEENGTLTGFKGKIFTVKNGDIVETNTDDFYKMMETGPSSSNPSTGGSPGTSKDIPTVSSQQQYDAIPSGAQYKDANGKIYKKK
jgi:hypothetical protein